MQPENNQTALQFRTEEKRKKLLAESITADFEKRRKDRVEIERQWELNLNFLKGNQYCYISKGGNVEQEDKEYFWQTREVYNHVSPIMETRLAKLSRVNPEISVRPKSDDDEDVVKATVAEKLIKSAFKTVGISETVRRATAWSETCGTVFYKVCWNNGGGMKMGVVDGEPVYEGEVEISVVSPFEIFPDSLYAEKLSDCKSIIHAKALSTSSVREKYGVSLVGKEIDVFGLTPATINSNKQDRVLENGVTVIEKYILPCMEYPNGRLITVAQDKVLYEGDLPYLNGENASRGYPFIKQDALPVAGSFFSASVVERLIPVQRAFNAVKNRKHEFMNRLSTGVMTVEDGAIDVDDLAEEGLAPGKVLVYRQGSKAPEMMNETVMPPDFELEENKLIDEFIAISGVSNVSSASKNANLASASALELLVEQDNERMVMNAEEIRQSYLEIARQILRLYAQFISGIKAVNYKDAFGRTKICYADKNTALSDDVFLEGENELSSTPTKKRETLFKLYDSGLLTDGEGKLRQSVKEKFLTLLGYKDLDYTKGLSRLHEEKAQNENESIRNKGLYTEEIDDHAIHIDEHVRYILSEYGELTKEEKERLFSHVKEHKEKLKQTEGNK